MLTMPQLEGASGDAFAIATKETIELKVDLNDDSPKKEASSEEETINGERDTLNQLEDGLKSLNIDSAKKRENPLPEREPVKGVTRDLVIEPVEVKYDKSQPASVVLIAGNNREIRPKIGIYSIEGRYLRPAKIKKWVMVVLFDKRAVEELSKGIYSLDDIQAFSERYVFVGRSKGVQVSPMSSIQCFPQQATLEKNVETMTSDNLKRELRELFTKLNDDRIDHAILIIPDNSPPWLHAYLQYLETGAWDLNKMSSLETLTRTSRVRYDTLMDLGIKCRVNNKKALIPSLWLKYNTKLGGINVALKRTFENHQARFLNEGHLFIGLDLYYPCANDEDFQMAFSVVVGMWDLAGLKMSFYTETRAQTMTAGVPSKMVAKNLDQMIKQVILSYKKRKNNRIPSKVIIFRSGAYKSSSEDDKIALQEIAEIKQALKGELSQENPIEPTLTYLRVPKKEKVRKYDNNHNTNKSATRPSLPESSVQTGSLVNSLMTENQEPEVRVVAANNQHLKPRVTLNISPDRQRSNVFKLYDEADFSTASIWRMVDALCYLSPRLTARTRPIPIDMADLAGERTYNIVKAWMADQAVSSNDPELIEKINKFLSQQVGCANYKSYLYYA